MIKLIYRIPQPTDAVSFYRGLGPMGELRKQMNVDYVTANDFHWSTMSMVDVLYVVRPSTNMDRDLINLAKACNVPIWIDYDDHILKVPNSNLTHSFYESSDIQNNVRYILANADVCTVSTQFLASEFNPYRPLGKPCVVIPNAFPDHLLDFDADLPERKNIISWRGSRTHDKDLRLAHGFFIEAQSMLPTWKFVFLGEPDWATQDLFQKNRIQVIPSTNVIDYFHKFHALGSTLHVAPLEDNPFNRSKSNISWIEASYAGAMTIGPDLPEWNMPGVVKDTAGVVALECLTAEGIVKENVEMSRTYIRENLMLSKVNRKRKAILESLVARR